MNTLSSPITSEIAATQSGWCEVYDFYLKSAVAAPGGIGSTSILRLCTNPAGIAFFTPKISPESAGTQGNAQTYTFWPIAREVVKGDAKFSADRMRLTASNATTEWAAMVAAIDWYDTPVIIRKVSLTIAGATADDCAILWSGNIDAVSIEESSIGMECSSDLAGLQSVRPAENMHGNCRFKWADDQCTQLRFRTTNYKTGTVGSSSTTTQVNSGDFTEDTNNGSSYGTDLVNPLLDAAITASSEGGNLTNVAVTVGDDTFTMGTPHKLSRNDQVVFSGTTAPTGITFGTTYYAIATGGLTFKVAAIADGPFINLFSTGSGVKVSTLANFAAAAVKSGNVGYWKLGDPNDWGTLSNGFYQIPDAQSGLANAALKPWINFDFGSAKVPTFWRISNVEGVRQEELTRMLVLFSSPDNSTWTFRQYLPMDPQGGILYEFQVPTAVSARYWRICVRQRWATALFYSLIGKVYAYESSRHYWQSGRITFAAATSTVALRGVSKHVLESYSGKIIVPALPVAPANGDTFTIERGCNRSFNHCATRQNTENFGGFLDLPYQQVIR